MANAAVTETLADRLDELGGLSADRVRMNPVPGTATVDDLVRVNHESRPLCELIDQTLVEKATGYEASVVAMVIARILGNFVASRRLGLVSGPDGMFQLLASTVRGPDVAFVSRDRLPDGRFPRDAYPAIAPDLVVEVLSPGNTRAEMARKRIEYFHSQVKLVWIVDCVDRSVAVYTSPHQVRVLNEEATLDGGDVLAGFSCAVSDLFTDLDLGLESAD